jgi:LPXTG-motif cell wall-anchored protein
MKKYLGLIPSPNTGDETAILIALLALSGIAIAVVPKRKRRI